MIQNRKKEQNSPEVRAEVMTGIGETLDDEIFTFVKLDGFGLSKPGLDVFDWSMATDESVLD
jgi:hypothetical protein